MSKSSKFRQPIKFENNSGINSDEMVKKINSYYGPPSGPEGVAWERSTSNGGYLIKAANGYFFKSRSGTEWLGELAMGDQAAFLRAKVLFANESAPTWKPDGKPNQETYKNAWNLKIGDRVSFSFRGQFLRGKITGFGKEVYYIKDDNGKEYSIQESLVSKIA